MAAKLPTPAARELARCPWAQGEEYVLYHDREWGVAVHDDRLLFEFLVLEGAQAGLSWATILKKRAGYRAAFDQFDPVKIARYGQRKRASLLADAGIVRNRLKIDSTIANAQALLRLYEEGQSLDRLLWSFVADRTVHNSWRHMRQVPPRTPQSDAMSKELKRRGFRFVGSTICYALMQACGLVNDHLLTCFRHAAIRRVDGD